jgi:hypothetical protein
VKKTPAGGLKDKLLRRKLTKTSSVAAPTDIILENKDSANGATPKAEPEKEGLKAKLLRRKNKKASDSAPPESPIPESKAEYMNNESETLTETPTSIGGGGLKAKLQRRKNKQASELAAQEAPHPENNQTEEVEQEEY